MNKIKLLSMISACLLAYNAQAATLIQNTWVSLPGTTYATEPNLGGMIMQDVLTPFSFSAYGGTVSGEVQNRVVLSNDGTYDFYWRVFNDANSAGAIQDWRIGNFLTGTYNANWRVDGSGDTNPTQAYLFGSAYNGYVNFNFQGATGGLLAGSSSKLFFLDTNATNYAKTATYDLTNVGQTEISSSYSTFAPAAAVPEPETYAMLLAGIGLIGFTIRRKQKSSL